MLSDLQEVTLSAGRIRYREYGSGPPIVFVHGVVVNGQLWRKVVPLLAPHFRCIVPDWPLGSHSVPMHPNADLRPPALAALVAELITTLDCKPVILVGSDTGGALCQMVATTFPDLVHRMVLTPCDAFENFPPFMFRYLRVLPRIPGALPLLGKLIRYNLIRRTPVAYAWLTQTRVPDAVLDAYTAPLGASPGVRHDARKVFTTISPQYTQEAAQCLRSFDKPVLIAWARHDRFFPFTHAEQLHTILPNATLVPIDDSYSFVAEDQPDTLAQAIITWS